MGENPNSFLSYNPVYDDVTVTNLENDFARIKGECYVDHAGATLYSDMQIRNVCNDLHHTLYANPHSIGTASCLTEDTIERMRYRILEHFHTCPDEYSVIFTSGATESLKIVAQAFLFGKDEKDIGDSSGHFVYTQSNHTSVLGMREVVADRKVKVTCLSDARAFNLFQHESNALLSNCGESSNSLFVYPAQCNFSGLKYPLSWIEATRNGLLSNFVSDNDTKWYVLLDAASYAATNDLDLSVVKPDFVCLSFYKMFGYPSGIGALLVRNSSATVLQKVYYGGGTVEVALSAEMFHVKRKVLHQRFEDGTISFLSIISLRHGFALLSNLGMKEISRHVFSLAQYLYYSLSTFHHNNGKPVAKLYSDTHYEDCDIQGGIVTFNLMRSTGEYVGYMEVLNMAALFKIHLRTGCFCNPGACQRHLELTSQEVLQNYDAGYMCGGAADLINGKPTGAIRVSFGYMSSIKDVERILTMIKECFISGVPIRKIPECWGERKIDLGKKLFKINGNATEFVTKDLNDKFDNECDDLTRSINSISVNNPIINEEERIKKFGKKLTVEQLYIYPIKSCAAFEITGSWNLNSKGLEHDREWMIVTSSGTCLTQKQHINLCLLKPVICKTKEIMQLTYPGMPVFELPLKQSSKSLLESRICQSRICGHKVEGIDCGSDVSEWLSLALGKPNLRLVKQSEEKLIAKGTNKSELSFSSQAQFLLINEASVYWLADQINDTEFVRDTILHRFRGNIIISGCEAFNEANWKSLSIGKNIFTVTGPCTRCQMICIDQTTGEKTIEPLRTLAERFHGKLKFGIYLTRESKSNATLSTGDTIYITE